MATWAKGIDFKNTNNTARIGGVGAYGTDSTVQKLYFGLGTEPWNNAGLQLTSSSINFKGNKIYHAGDKPTASEIGAAPSSHTHSSLKSTDPVRPTSANLGVVADRSLSMMLSTSSMTTGKPLGDGYILNFNWDNNGGWASQLYVQNSSSPKMQVRGMNAGTWGEWNTLYGTNNKPTPAEIGAAASSHTHSYLPLSGGTMTGAITTPNNAQGIKVGDDAVICDRNVGNHIVIEGATATEGGITFGSGKDTNIYRGGANILKTDDTFNAVGGLQWNGQSLDARYMRQANANGYYGMTANGDTSNWVRTTNSGIIPYQSGGASSLGTSSWPFNNIYANNIYDNGTLLEDKFLGKTATATASNYLASNTRMDYNWNGVNYFNINGTAGAAAKANDTPTSAWWHVMRFNHQNSSGYYTDLAIPFNTTSLYYKRITSGSVQNGGWIKVLDSLNYNEYAPTKTGGGASGTWGISVSGNSATATKLQTTRTINGTSFDGSANITTANWGTARTLTIGNTGKSVNGSGNVSWTLSEIGAAASSHTHSYAGSSSAGGNANAAVKLATARTINGTNFDGSANITTANWGTARTLTIGSTGKSVNGSENVSWTLNEIGARPRIKKVIDLSNTTTYPVDKWYPCLATIPYDGMHDIEVAVQLNSGVKPSWSTHQSGFTCNLHVKAIAGGWGTTSADSIVLNHSYSFASANPCSYSQLNNSSNAVLWLRGGGKYFVFTDWNASWSVKTASTEISSQTVAPATSCPSISLTKSTMIANLSGNATTATTLQTARTINGTSFNGSGNITTANWGTARTITIGNTGKSVNGSGNVSWSLSEIGAAASSHTHNYLPLSGGTISGETVFNNYLSLNAWSGYGTGKAQIWYNGNNKQLIVQPNAVTDIIVNNNKVYHAGNKPTASDIGAAASNHTHGLVNLNSEAFCGGNDLNTYNSTKTWVARTINTTTNRPHDYYTVVNFGANSNSNFQLAHNYGNNSILYVRGRHDTSGNYTPWAKVYTDKNKPTAADIGAAASNHTHSNYATGALTNSYNNGTSEPCEGYIHLGGSKYLMYGYCSISLTANVGGERTYSVPGCKRIYGITLSCYTKGGTGNFGELALKQTYSDGFTFRLWNVNSGGAHYITYMIIGDR